MIQRLGLHAVAIGFVLGVSAALAPTPASSDRGIYDQIGRLLIRDCADGHCFRPLLAGVLEHLPGPSLVKWKTYAVVANTIAGVDLGATTESRIALGKARTPTTVPGTSPMRSPTRSIR